MVLREVSWGLGPCGKRGRGRSALAGAFPGETGHATPSCVPAMTTVWICVLQFHGEWETS